MTAPTTVLSPREVQVLALVCADLTDREIAAQLYITPGTVEVYVQHIRTKLGVEGWHMRGAFYRELVREMGL